VAGSRITHLTEAREVRIDAGRAPMAVAVDGEALAGARTVEYRVVPKSLAYYTPRS
jgi:diacylglycerol kinase family enzyme